MRGCCCEPGYTGFFSVQLLLKQAVMCLPRVVLRTHISTPLQEGNVPLLQVLQAVVSQLEDGQEPRTPEQETEAAQSMAKWLRVPRHLLNSIGAVQQHAKGEPANTYSPGPRNSWACSLWTDLPHQAVQSLLLHVSPFICQGACACT